jgi:hypothetical protein
MPAAAVPSRSNLSQKQLKANETQMSTAVIISGQMRTFAQCYPTQKWQIFRHYEPDIHFFVSCVDDAQASSAELLRENYQNVHIERYTDPVLSVIPDSAGAHAPYKNATSHQKLLLQHWANKRAWDFFLASGKSKTCDTVIRIRPDQYIHRFQKPSSPTSYQCYCPWWGKFGGVNDRLAIMGDLAADGYFNTWSSIDLLLARGCPFHPETLVMESMKLQDVEIIPRLMTSFSTMRLNGQQRWPEITTEDLAELYAGSN